MPTSFNDAGMFGGPATLPTDPGPVDPPILTGDYPYSLGNVSPGGGDFWTRIDPNMGYIDPTLTVYPANPADAYPSPGTGAPPPPRQSVLGRIAGNIPAVRVAQFLANLMRGSGQNWQQNAASNVPVRNALPTNAAVFGYAPNSGGGAQNPLYNTGNGWQPVANAPSDIRWLPNSGTGNFQADQTTKAFELAGGYVGTPNRTTVTDRGIDRFRVLLGPGGRSATTRRYDEESGRYMPVTTMSNPAQQAAARDLYQQALAAVPMNPSTGFDLAYTQQLNDWIRAHQNSGLPPASMGTIAQQPILPGA